MALSRITNYIEADGADLNLQSSDTTITASSVLGVINFKAPSEASGTDAILLASKIEAVAEGTFSSSSNATKLSFATASSEAAAEKMALTSGGDLKIVTDGASIFFGADSEIELRHVADDGLILKHVGTGDGKEPSLTFQAGDNDIAQDDVLGQINFQAPDEGAGTDAVTVAGHIKCISEGDFSSTNNEALLEFATGDSAAAGTDGGRLRLKPTGILELKDMRTADGSSPTLVLQTGDTDIAQNDILGTINFQAPDEGTGTDAILVAAGIEAISEGDFSSSSNATSLRFKTGSSAAASERMRLTSAGRLGINTTSPDALLDVEGTTDAEIRVTRTTANFSASTNTDAGSVLNLENKALFENGYGGDSNVGQILFNSQDDSTGQGLRAKIACHKIGFGHFESLSFHVSPGNTTSNQALASGTNNTSLAKRMEIDANGTTTIGGDLFNDSGDKTTANPVGLVVNMLDGDTRGLQFNRGATDNQAGDGQCIGQVGARANTDGSNTMATASAKIFFEQAGASSGTSAGCGFKIFTKDTTIGPGSAPTLKFAISSDGNLTATDTNIGSISDERLKKNIQDYAYDLDKFKQFKPRTFEWRNPTMHTFEDTTGFVAQELSAIDSSLSYDKEGTIDKPYADTEVYKEGDTIPSGKKVGDLLPDAQEKKDAYDAEMALLSGDKQKAAKLGKKDAMYVSVIQQLITRIEALESK